VALLGAAGALGGLGTGLVNLALATAGALLVTRLRGRQPAGILGELLG
jgi:hypothetical protein